MSSYDELKQKWANAELLTKKQAAELLQVSCRTIESYSANRNFPTMRISSRKVLYPKKGVLQWLNQTMADR